MKQISNSVFELLVSNLERLDEKEDADRQGVFAILGVFENLLSFMPPLADEVGSTTPLLKWLLNRMSLEAYDSNKQYASEILSILLQSSRSNSLKVIEMEGVDKLLTVLSVRAAAFCVFYWLTPPTAVSPSRPPGGGRGGVHGEHVQLFGFPRLSARRQATIC